MSDRKRASPKKKNLDHTEQHRVVVKKSKIEKHPVEVSPKISTGRKSSPKTDSATRSASTRNRTTPIKFNPAGQMRSLEHSPIIQKCATPKQKKGLTLTPLSSNKNKQKKESISPHSENKKSSLAKSPRKSNLKSPRGLSPKASSKANSNAIRKSSAKSTPKSKTSSKPKITSPRGLDKWSPASSPRKQTNRNNNSALTDNVASPLKKKSSALSSTKKNTSKRGRKSYPVRCIARSILDFYKLPHNKKIPNPNDLENEEECFNRLLVQYSDNSFKWDKPNSFGVDFSDQNASHTFISIPNPYYQKNNNPSTPTHKKPPSEAYDLNRFVSFENDSSATFQSSFKSEITDLPTFREVESEFLETEDDPMASQSSEEDTDDEFYNRIHTEDLKPFEKKMYESMIDDNSKKR